MVRMAEVVSVQHKLGEEGGTQNGAGVQATVFLRGRRTEEGREEEKEKEGRKEEEVINLLAIKETLQWTTRITTVSSALTLERASPISSIPPASSSRRPPLSEARFYSSITIPQLLSNPRVA